MSVPLTLSEVPNVTPYIQYVATSGQTAFDYPFPITQDSDLIVVVNGTTLNTDSGYSLSGQGDDTGGTLTFNSGQSAGTIITLYRDIAIERITQIGQNSGFSSTTFNAEFNNIYLIMQQLEAAIAQCLQIPNTNNPAPTTTLTPSAYANMYLAFDENGNPEPALLTSSGSLTASIIAALTDSYTAAPLLASQVRTAQEIAANVTPTNYSYPYGHAWRYGVRGDGATDVTTEWNNWIAAIEGNAGYLPVDAGAYVLADGFTISGHTGTRITSDPFAEITVSTGTENTTTGFYFAATLNNCYLCDFRFGYINSSVSGVIMTSSSSGTTNTNVFVSQLVGPGRVASKPATPTTAGNSIGILVLGPALGDANYYHTIGVGYASGFDTTLAAYTPSGGLMNANQNRFSGQIAGYWYGAYTNSAENTFDLRCDDAAGSSGSVLTEGVRIGDGTYTANYNTVVGVMEPGTDSQAYNCLANSINNKIIVQDNCDHSGTDSGTNQAWTHDTFVTSAAVTLNGGVTLAAPGSGDTIDVAAPNTNGDYGVNITASGADSTAIKITGTAAGTPTIVINTQATTGTATPTLGTNKPGSNSTPSTWIPVTVDGTKLYIPAWS